MATRESRVHSCGEPALLSKGVSTQSHPTSSQQSEFPDSEQQQHLPLDKNSAQITLKTAHEGQEGVQESLLVQSYLLCHLPPLFLGHVLTLGIFRV